MTRHVMHGSWAILALVTSALTMGGPTGCAHPRTHHFYTLTYPMGGKASRVTYPYVVRVKDFDISPTYGVVQLVRRKDVHEIQYSSTERWTERPQKMITSLVRKHLERSGLVAQVVDRMGEQPPDFVLSGEIEAIETLDTRGESLAHLAMTLTMTRFDDNHVVWRHTFDRRAKAPSTRGRAVVASMSRLLELEMMEVLDSLRGFFGTLSGAPIAKAEADVTTASGGPVDEQMGPGEEPVFGPDLRSPLLSHPQLLADETPMPPQMGAVFLPALSDPDREPPVAIYAHGKVVAQGRMGSRILVQPGVYDVRFGSGTVEQQITVKVRVVAGRVTPVEPTWASLEVRVVDKHFIGFRGSYELIQMSTRDEYGIGFGAREEVGEKPKVWVLRPGLYKIIRAGGNYRDRTDFATVLLQAGKLTRFILVLDQDTESFLGAGEIQRSEEEAVGPWRFHGLVGGDMQLNRHTRDMESWALQVNLYFDASASYQEDPHRFTTRLEIEEGQLQPADSERFQNLTDRLYFQTLYIYNLEAFQWLGPYARLRTDSKLLPRYKDFEEARDVQELDEGGRVVEVHRDVDRVNLGGLFSPLEFSEGVGANFTLVRTLAVDLDVRLGFGARQGFANHGLTMDDQDRLVPLASFQKEGIEAAVAGSARISRWITLDTEFEPFVDFGELDNPELKWVSYVRLRLSSFASLAYRLEVKRLPFQTTVRSVDPTTFDHRVQLRLSYTLF